MQSRVLTSLRAVAGTLALTAALGGTAASQTFESSSYAECITGSEIGCQQVDFFFTLLADSASATINQFTISLLGDGWFFSAVQGGEAESSGGGDTFFLGDVSGDGRVLTGSFFPGFEPLLNPWLRVRAEFAHEPDAFASTETLAYSYALFNDDELVAAGQVPPEQVVPEPVSMLLLGTGLAGVAAARRRRRRPDQDAAA